VLKMTIDLSEDGTLRTAARIRIKRRGAGTQG